MSQRYTKHGMQGEPYVCEKFMNKMVNHEKQLNDILAATVKERVKRDKTRPNIGVASAKPTRKTVQYLDPTALQASTLDIMKKQKHKGFVPVQKESWDKMLKEHRTGDKFSVFGSFDPLRTLHFLSKELQYQLQSILPDDETIQQMVTDMQHALKRVPPEIASSVHLLADTKNLQEKLKQREINEDVIDCGVQTEIRVFDDNYLNKIMAESTMKLESSCRQLEGICTVLKKEKNDIQLELDEVKRENNTLQEMCLDLKEEKKKLQLEVDELKTNCKLLSKIIDDTKYENKEVLKPRITSLESEKQKLENEIKSITAQCVNQYQQKINNLKSHVSELKSQKNTLEQDSIKLKHQIKIDALEREKYKAVLTLRDSQINEIKNEMTKLQKLVNQQLMDVHNDAFENAPDSKTSLKCGIISGEKEDNTISTINTNEDYNGKEAPMSSVSFKELQSGDSEAHIPELDNVFESLQIKDQNFEEEFKSMFDELKKNINIINK